MRFIGCVLLGVSWGRLRRKSRPKRFRMVEPKIGLENNRHYIQYVNVRNHQNLADFKFPMESGASRRIPSVGHSPETAARGSAAQTSLEISELQIGRTAPFSVRSSMVSICCTHSTVQQSYCRLPLLVSTIALNGLNLMEAPSPRACAATSPL